MLSGAWGFALSSRDDNIQRVLVKHGATFVVTGRAIKEDAKYRYTWLVRFCHPAVIDSYRDHPDHVDFADQHFRPVAGNRISIDYKRVNTLTRQPQE